MKREGLVKGRDNTITRYRYVFITMIYIPTLCHYGSLYNIACRNMVILLVEWVFYGGL